MSTTPFIRNRNGTMAEAFSRLWDECQSEDVDLIRRAGERALALQGGFPEPGRDLAGAMSVYARFRGWLVRYEKPDLKAVDEAVLSLEALSTAKAAAPSVVADAVLGELLLFRGQPSRSLKALRRVTRSESPIGASFGVQFLLAQALCATGRNARGMAVLKKTLRMDLSAHQQARALLLLADESVGRKQAACLRELTVLVESHSDSLPADIVYEYNLQCAWRASKTGDLNLALEHFHGAWDLLEGIESVLAEPAMTPLGIATTHLVKGEHAQACPFFRAVLDKARESRVKFQAFVGLGQCHARLGEYELAIEQYSRALDVADRPRARAAVALRIGHLQQASGDWAQALRAYSEALKAVPLYDRRYRSRGSRHFLVGLSLHKLGRNREARKHLRKAISFWSRVLGLNLGCETGAYYYLGAIAEEANSFRRAIRLYRRARKHGWTEDMLDKSATPRQHAEWLVDIYSAMARCCDKLGKRRRAKRYRDAAARVERLRDSFPEDPEPE